MARLLAVLLTALAVALSACGGDDDDGAPAAGGDDAPATTATTAADASAACEEVEEHASDEGRRLRCPTEELDPSKTYTAVMKTSEGTLEIELDVKRAPLTAASFAHLARRSFYDGLTFHRVVPGFVVQGGDPTGTGMGGPGYQVTEAPPDDVRYERGVVAMAKGGQDPAGTSGSQFFIVTGDDAGLPPDYALVGRVTKGDDVLDRLDAVETDPAEERPLETVLIEKVTIRES
jgi:cyclophilin family peptidyl-prolyl cis-trans isomerase